MCSSSGSARFWSHGAHTFWFCTLIAILDPFMSLKRQNQKVLNQVWGPSEDRALCVWMTHIPTKLALQGAMGYSVTVWVTCPPLEL
jgi:hypothetical protein